MDAEVRERVERAAEVHALLNAMQHDGAAQVGTVVGALMAEHPTFREHGDAVAGAVAPVVERVNALPTDEQRERLGELAPDRLAEVEAEAPAEDDPLGDLPNVHDAGQVRMRLAPNPNGQWHLGNARMPAVIGTYKERYDGWMLCRFDDTDPDTKRPDLEAYDAILRDLEYLGFEPDEVIRASDRLELYYDRARELVDLGGAYTCSCPAAAFRERKAAGEACPHREKDASTVREEFDRMVDGGYDAGEMVLRVRTAIDHDNPALRDWVAFRLVDRPHPREAAAGYRCWPMLDFQSGIDDHETGITHIIRGIDLQDSAKRQQFVYDYFGWSYPEVVHWGHVQVDEYDVKLSTSTIKDLIDRGDLDGWDDPRAPTVASLRRRGIRGEAIVGAMVELGTSPRNVDLAMSSIYAQNRELVDAVADRYFLVRAGRSCPVLGAPATGTPPVHPEFPDRGTREVPVGEAVLLEAPDVPDVGERLWLKGLGGFRLDGGTLVYETDDIDWVRDDGVPVVHWVPREGGVDVRLRTPTGDVRGVAEPAFDEAAVDEVVQFERVGFARVDATDQAGRVAFFAHP
ncbi:MAG: glutamate--tRNA ligase [Halobacteriales archaeon]